MLIKNKLISFLVFRTRCVRASVD